jgi:hypothetical protein
MNAAAQPSETRAGIDVLFVMVDSTVSGLVFDERSVRRTHSATRCDECVPRNVGVKDV